MLSTWDDHELINDYDVASRDRVFQSASDMNARYLGDANPVTYQTEESASEILLPIKYYHFDHGDRAFFVMDTRTFRNYSVPRRTMLGDAQLTSLLQWIERKSPEAKWLVLVTSVPFTVIWPSDDTWRGYIHERELILNALRRAKRRHHVQVVILSGDRHQIASTEIIDHAPSDMTEDQAGSAQEMVIATEFSVGPLNMFWVPFSVCKSTWNHPPGASRAWVLESPWKVDRILYYEVNIGPTAIGHVSWRDNEMVFCVFGKRSGSRVNVTTLRDCGHSDGVEELVNQRLLFRHVVRGDAPLYRPVQLIEPSFLDPFHRILRSFIRFLGRA
jgi:hypothetical protein